MKASANDLPLSASAFPLVVGLVCQSNVNRSMEAHAALASTTLPITLKSYGVGRKVRLPGETAETPNVYSFTTTYKDMIADLQAKNARRYTSNGILPMLQRDAIIKARPNQWQNDATFHHVVITFESRVFDVVCADFVQRWTFLQRPSHVFCLDTTDNRTEAKVSAALVVQFMTILCAFGDGWESSVSTAMETFYEQTSRELLYNVAFC